MHSFKQISRVFRTALGLALACALLPSFAHTAPKEPTVSEKLGKLALEIEQIDKQIDEIKADLEKEQKIYDQAEAAFKIRRRELDPKANDEDPLPEKIEDAPEALREELAAVFKSFDVRERLRKEISEKEAEKKAKEKEIKRLICERLQQIPNDGVTGDNDEDGDDEADCKPAPAGPTQIYYAPPAESRENTGAAPAF